MTNRQPPNVLDMLPAARKLAHTVASKVGATWLRAYAGSAPHDVILQLEIDQLHYKKSLSVEDLINPYDGAVRILTAIQKRNTPNFGTLHGSISAIRAKNHEKRTVIRNP